jgi:hypothetical protein
MHGHGHGAAAIEPKTEEYVISYLNLVDLRLFERGLVRKDLVWIHAGAQKAIAWVRGFDCSAVGFKRRRNRVIASWCESTEIGRRSMVYFLE